MNHDVSISENLKIQDTPAKPKPQCCEPAKTGAVWREDKALGNDHKPGWTLVAGVSIPNRIAWFFNPTHCPYCGSKLPT